MMFTLNVIHMKSRSEAQKRRVNESNIPLCLPEIPRCGMEKGCRQIKESDYRRLTAMIDNDSINYSPPKTFTDREIKATLDRIRKGE